MGLTEIVVRGARQHNLKNINLRIPRNALTVITGLSGSGKSSLAFDTIYAEGQRRYVESLSAYARQFLDQMERPEVDSIEGLSPSIAIEQKTTTRSPRSFSDDINVRTKINNLGSFKCSDGWGKAHVVVNRSGEMLLDHDFAIPWRETRFEQAANFAGALKGLFLHVELIQPRRSAAGRGWRNDAQPPNPAFTPAQYDRLALLYVIASVRAEHWLVPAFHAAIDAGIRNGHDDPLHFDVASFADSVRTARRQTRRRVESTAAAIAGRPVLGRSRCHARVQFSGDDPVRRPMPTLHGDRDCQIGRRRTTMGRESGTKRATDRGQSRAQDRTRERDQE